MDQQFHQYEVPPAPMWSHAVFLGDGYDVMMHAEQRRWETIAHWGEGGWDLGSWPLVMVFWRTSRETNTFDVVEYVEGDVTCWQCPTAAIREQITDSLAFFHWKQQGCAWAAAYDNETVAPPALRGPYGATRGKS